MHPYRTHNCGELRAENAGSEVRLSGWVHRKRDHGNLLFLDQIKLDREDVKVLEGGVQVSLGRVGDE